MPQVWTGLGLWVHFVSERGADGEDVGNGGCAKAVRRTQSPICGSGGQGRLEPCSFHVQYGRVRARQHQAEDSAAQPGGEGPVAENVRAREQAVCQETLAGATQARAVARPRQSVLRTPAGYNLRRAINLVGVNAGARDSKISAATWFPRKTDTVPGRSSLVKVNDATEAGDSALAAQMPLDAGGLRLALREASPPGLCSPGAARRESP